MVLAILSRLAGGLLWAFWLCAPSSIRLSIYRRLSTPLGVTAPSVARLPFGLILKCTMDPDYIEDTKFVRKNINASHLEAANTRFIGEHTSIPVPRILDVISFDDFTGPQPLRRGVIVMTSIEGHSLRHWLAERTTWPPEYHHQLRVLRSSTDEHGRNNAMKVLDSLEPTLDLSDGVQLLADLRRVFQELRALQPPSSSAVSGLDNSPLIMIARYEFLEPISLGPFNDANAFHNGLFVTAPRKRLALIRQLAIPVHAKTHRICFTHADLNSTNILVKDGRLAGLLDWQFSGWYPEYWEYTQLQFRTERAKAEHAFWKVVGLFDEEQYREELLLEHGFWGPDKLFENDM